MTTKTIKNEYFVQGMHCAACEFMIENEIGDLPNVVSVKAKLNDAKVYIESTAELDEKVLNKAVESGGYKISKEKAEPTKTTNKSELYKAFFYALLVFGAFILLQKMGILNIFGFEKTNLPVVFGIGVLASVSTCMAVVGGLVLSLSSNYAKNEQTKPLVIFHASRVIGFFFLGGVIGLLGSAFILTPISSLILNLGLFLVMVGIGINLLEIPQLKNLFQIKMPKVFGEKLMEFKKESQGKASLVVPAILGAGTFFLPCGFTQSMQIFALTKGTFMGGALTMLVFSLGTLPVLAGISILSTKYAQNTNKNLFFKTAGFLVILFATMNLLGALAGAGIIPPILNF